LKIKQQNQHKTMCDKYCSKNKKKKFFCSNFRKKLIKTEKNNFCGNVLMARFQEKNI